MKKQILTPVLDSMISNTILPYNERVNILTNKIIKCLYDNYTNSDEHINTISFTCDKYEIDLTFYFDPYFLLNFESTLPKYVNLRLFTDFILQPDICTISLSLQKENIPDLHNIYEISNIIMKHITSFPVIDYHRVFQTQLELYKKLHNTPLSERNEINILKEIISVYYVYILSISKNELDTNDIFKITLESLSDYLELELYYPV